MSSIFRNLFDRMKFLNGASIHVPAALQNLTWTRIVIHPDGSASPAGSVQMATPPFGEPVSVTVQSGANSIPVTGEIVRYDHLDGGLLYLPPTAGSGPRSIHTALDGQTVDVWIP